VEARQDRRRVKELERELHRKDKALAETAALLVLSKKLMWTAPKWQALRHFAEAPHSISTWGTGQNEPSTACKPASRLVAEVKPRSREAGRRRRRA
jgi:hypothetical protein